MKLNLEFYDNSNENVPEYIENLINKYIDKSDSNDYESFFGEIVDDNEQYYLSRVSQNVINWYPFNSNDSVLEIGGGLGQITQVFLQKCKTVVTIEPNIIKAQAIEKRYKKQDNLEVIVGNLKNIKLNKKFKYITLFGIDSRIDEIYGENIKLKDLIQNIENYLEDDGKILIAVDNKFGIRFFSGNPENILQEKFGSLDGYYRKDKEIESFTRTCLEKIFIDCGYKFNFYYPLPDYKLPNVIFSDNNLPDFHTFERYLPYYSDSSAIIMNELDVFREILKENKDLFKFFTNSFLVEISKKEINQKYNYISFNNLRKPKYRLVTKIADEYVEKNFENSSSEDHYNRIKENISILINNNIKTLDYIKDGKIHSKYINQNLRLDNIIIKNILENNFEEVDLLFKKYIDLLFKDSYKEENYENTVFFKYNIEIENKEILKEMHFLKNGLWDMIFQNCFYIDGEFYFFDQEWYEENLPAEYILYRAMFYTLPLRKYLYQDNKNYGLKKFLKLFEELDHKYQKEIYDDRMWNFYYQNKYYDLDATKQEIINQNIRIDAMQGAIDNFQKETNDWKSEYSKLQKETNDLKSKYSQLQNNYDILQQNYSDYVNRIHQTKIYRIYKILKKGNSNE